MRVWSAVINEPGKEEKRISLRPGLRIGRHPKKNDLVLSELTASGEHAEIVERAGKLMLRDRGSTSHTRIEGGPELEKGQEHPVEPGMVAYLGLVRMQFEVQGEDEEKASRDDGKKGPRNTEPARTEPARSPATVPARGLVPAQGDARSKNKGEKASLDGVGADARDTEPARAEPAAKRRAAGAALDGVSTVPADEKETVPASGNPGSAQRPLEPAPAPKRQLDVPETPERKDPVTPSPDEPPPRESAPPPVPAKSAAESDLTGPQPGSGTQDYGQDSPEAIAAFLKAARPRLVLDEQEKPRIIDITRVPFVLGREERWEKEGCRIPHPGFSDPHAQILVKGMRFILQDGDGMGKKSKGHVFVDLMEMQVETHEIRSGMYLKFAFVPALFVAEVDQQGRPIAKKSHDRTARTLLRRGRISSSQLRTARAAAKAERRHVGEMLIVQRAINAREWAETHKAVLEQAGGRDLRPLVWFASGVILALAVAGLLLMGLGR